jgi:hypothetical protein
MRRELHRKSFGEDLADSCQIGVVNDVRSVVFSELHSETTFCLWFR